MFNPLSKVRGTKQLFRHLCPPGNPGKSGESRVMERIVWEMLCRKWANKTSMSSLQGVCEGLNKPRKHFLVFWFNHSFIVYEWDLRLWVSIFESPQNVSQIPFSLLCFNIHSFLCHFAFPKVVYSHCNIIWILERPQEFPFFPEGLHHSHSCFDLHIFNKEEKVLQKR